MNLASLNFSALPAISIVYRFFISAILFALVGVCIIAFSTADIWQSRWHPHMLAVTHTFTLGVITTIMMGALLQILPVIGGIGLPKIKLVANTFLSLHISGTTCLIFSFIWPTEFLKIAAIVLLAAGFGIYLLALIWVLMKKLSQGSTIVAIRFSVLALATTLLLGLLMQARSLGIELLPGDKYVTDLHAVWGIAGWFGLLIIGVSFQIIPMFHVAPEFAATIRTYLPKSIIVLLIVLLIIPVEMNLIVFLLLSLNTLFIGYLCYLLSMRKRKIPDTTVNFWRLACFSMLTVFILYCVPKTLLPELVVEKYTLLLAALVIYVYVLSIILGMLIKIIPFLSYTHLQQRCLLNFSLMPLLPNMHQLLAKKHAKILFYLHLCSSATLLTTIMFNQFYWLLAIALFVEFSWLLSMLVRCKRIYEQTVQKIDLQS